jgi:hypothetical protein
MGRTPKGRAMSKLISDYTDKKLKAEMLKMLEKRSPLSWDDKERIRAVLEDMV